MANAFSHTSTPQWASSDHQSYLCRLDLFFQYQNSITMAKSVCKPAIWNYYYATAAHAHIESPPTRVFNLDHLCGSFLTSEEGSVSFVASAPLHLSFPHPRPLTAFAEWKQAGLVAVGSNRDSKAYARFADRSIVPAVKARDSFRFACDARLIRQEARFGEGMTMSRRDRKEGIGKRREALFYTTRHVVFV